MPKHKTNFDTRSASYLALGCVGALAVAAPAAAQDEDVTQLEGITVTDTYVEDGYKADEIRSPKATAPILDTPRTINVVTEEVIADSASFSFEEALRNVPGITLGAGEGGTASADIPFIRGTDATSDVYVDGARDVGSQTRETFAVEQIEIFKGPNSAFGGRGGAAGTINLVTKTPKLDQFVSGTATIGTDDLYRATFDVNQPLTDTIAVRLNALYHESEVAGRDAVYDDRWGVQPSIAFGLGTETQASLSYYHYETDGIPDYGLPYRLVGGVRSAFDDDEVDFDNFYGLVDRDFQKTSVDAVTLQFDHDFGAGWSLYSTMRYSGATNDYIVTNPDDSKGNVASGLVWRGDKTRFSENESYVFNAGSTGLFELAGMAHSVSFGAEVTASDTDRDSYELLAASGADYNTTQNCTAADIALNYCTSLTGPDPYGSWNGSYSLLGEITSTRANSYGFYAFDSITVIPELIVNLGLRWEQFNVKAARTNPNNAARNYSVKNNTDSLSYQAGLVYKPVDALSIYASYANSASPPGTDVGEGQGTNVINTTREDYDPLETENYEIGVKYDAFGGDMLLSAALFRVDRSDFVEESATGVTTTVDNEARTQGIELGLAGSIGPVSLSGGYVYIDSELRNGANEGNRLPNTAKHNISLWSEVAITDLLSLGGGAYYTGKRFSDTANTIEIDDYWRFDAMASYQLNDNIALRANVKNVFDERYYGKLNGRHFATPAAGRQGVLTVSFTY